MIKYKGKHWLVITAAVSGILFIYIFFKKTPPDIYWGKDTKQMYKIVYKETSDNWSLNSKKNSRKIHLHGTLNFRIFQISNTVKAGIQLSGMTLLYNGKRYDALDKIYTTIFLIEFNKNGRIESFHFSNEIAREDGNEIASIFKLLQLIIENSITAAWDTKESDMFGTYYAEYIYKNGILNKNKLHYLALLDKHGNLNNKFTSTIRNSHMIATYGEPVSWLKKISLHEKVSVFTGDNSYATYDRVLNMKKTRFKPVKKRFIWRYDGTYDDLIKLWNSREKNTISFESSLKLQELKKMYGPATTSNMIKIIASSADTEKANTVSDLKDFISILPDESNNIEQAITKPNLTKNNKKVLIQVLADAGHLKAQQALCRIMNDVEYDTQIRNSAAAALGSIEDPSSETINELWNTYHTYTPKYHSLSGNAISSLAQISHSLSLSNDSQKQEHGEEIRDKILSQFESAKTSMHTALLLKAAGKTGHEDAIDEIEDYIDSSSTMLRIAAISSLQGIESTKADDILVERLSEEELLSIKKIILQVLMKRTVNEKVIDELIDFLPEEKDRSAREFIYRYILKAKNYSIADEKLNEIKKNELSAGNKKLIDAIIKIQNSNKK